MERIEKEINVNQIVVTFVAIDGTEFSSESYCEKYEKSLKCSIGVRLKDITIARENQEIVFLQGADDCDCQIVRPRNGDDINAINQMICLTCNQDPEKINGENLAHDENIGECIVICYSYDRDWAWMYTESRIRNHWDKMFANKD